MIVPRRQDANHKAQLYRLLGHILDHPQLSQALGFRGGTCAALLGWLDRFSVDLDFDMIGKDLSSKALRSEFHQLFASLQLEIEDERRKVLQFFLKYQSPPRQRSAIRIDAFPPAAKANQYQPQFLKDLDRYAICQTKETMVANKLATVPDRWQKHRAIAGRDLYDIHHFLSQGFTFDPQVIKDRLGIPPKQSLKRLISFIDKRVTQRVIDQDLNTLLPPDRFRAIRSTLKQETIALLKDELVRQP